MRAFTITLALALSFLDSSSQAAVVNLVDSASGFGQLPVITLNQGTPAGIADGSMFSWFQGATSPRNFTATNIQPYATWASPQTVRSVRVWDDVNADNSGPYDRVMIDTLVGTDPTVEANWVNRYDSGTGLAGAAAQFQDVDLGANYNTQGVRVRAFSTAGDINVGEVAVFGPQGLPGTLSNLRVFPTSGVASSFQFRPDALAINANWFDGGWLSNTQAANPGSEFTYDQFFGPEQMINGASLTWTTQGGFSARPSQWELLADTGDGLESLGIFGPTIAQNGQTRNQYYYNLGFLEDVQQLRIRVLEANVAGGFGIGLVEFEAFETLPPVPEPTTIALVGLGAMGLLRARRRRN